jgi:hypothetical protein
MEGLFDNPFIIIALILFIVVRFFNALQEKSKNRRSVQTPPADTETFENTDYWNAAEQEPGKEAVVKKNEGKEKRIVQEEDYFPFPQGLGGFTADRSIPRAEPLPKARSVLVDIKKEKIETGLQGSAPDMQRPENIHFNSAPARPYSEPVAGLREASGQNSPLKKAVIWAEILGPPRGLKDF